MYKKTPIIIILALVSIPAHSLLKNRFSGAFTKRNCRKLCAAKFVQQKRNRGETGIIDYNKVAADVMGYTKKRRCLCTYGDKKNPQWVTGFNHIKKRGSLGKEFKELCKASRDGKCNSSQDVCLINAPWCIYAMADKS